MDSKRSTDRMQARLEEAMAAGRLEPGKSYDIMPSDCRGDGYDIAMTSRADESGDYQVSGHLCRVTCMVRVGSRNWRDGIPAGYRLDVDPAVPYTLQSGERAEVIHRDGNHIGNGYMHRVLASLAIRREDGHLVYRGHTPYWLDSTATYAAHYNSGLSKRDAESYNQECARLETIAAQINTTGR